MNQTNTNDAHNDTVSISVTKTPQEVFQAINDVRGWWIGEIEGDADNVGSEFTYSYKDFHRTTQKVIEQIPQKKVVWTVTQSKINFVPNKNEWLGTQIIFELTPEGKGTRINFTHLGLTPKIECYEGCSGGWDFYIQKSLKNFIEKGEGIDPKF